MASNCERARVGTQGVPTGRRRPGLLFAPLRERFCGRGPGVLCFVLARATHAPGCGTVQCREGERRRWSGGVRGPGSGGHGWCALGCAQCLCGRGEGAAASRPALQGFCRAQRQRVGVRGGGGRVGGCMLVLNIFIGATQNKQTPTWDQSGCAMRCVGSVTDRQQLRHDALQPAVACIMQHRTLLVSIL